jgi:hypothetical protein
VSRQKLLKYKEITPSAQQTVDLREVLQITVPRRSIRKEQTWP